MSLGAPELLLGNFLCLLQPSPPESAGEFMANKVGVIGLISLIAAQEAEKGVANLIAENRAIRLLLQDVVEAGHAGPLTEASEALARETDDDFTLTALNINTNRLRLNLIALHEYAELQNLKALERRIVQLLLATATAHRLDLPPMPA